jgi:hypothetical protein
VPSANDDGPGPGRHFTLAEANAAVVGLRERLSRVMQLRTRLKTLHLQFAAAGVRPTVELASGLDVDQTAAATPELTRDAALFHALLATLDEELAAIRTEGCQVKDVEVGLVDWPALHDGREVLLCWRLGEPSVGYWHETEAGYAGRRPVAELEE